MDIVIYALLGLLIAMLELPRRFRQERVDAFTFFNALYFIFFVFVPMNVIYFGSSVVRQKYAYETFGGGDEYTALVLLFTYILFYFGASIKLKSSQQTCQKKMYATSGSIKVAVIIFLLGFGAMMAHIVRVGGVSEVILLAQALRAETLIQSNWLWMNFLSPFLADTFVLICAVIVGKKSIGEKISQKFYLILLLAFIGFVYYALSTAGRRSFIYPVLIIYLIYLSVKGRIELRTMVGILGFLFGLIGLGTIMLATFTTDNEFSEDWLNLLATGYFIAVQGLADTYIHFVGAQHAELWQFGFLADIVSLPTDFFPSQLFGFERTRGMYGETSEFFLGHALEDGFSGEEPLGLHGYLLVNFGYIGMCFVFFVLGLGCRWLHVKLKPAVSSDAVGWLVYWWIFFGSFVYFREGVAILVFKSHLTWWITIALLILIARISPMNSAVTLRTKNQTGI